MSAAALSHRINLELKLIGGLVALALPLRRFTSEVHAMNSSALEYTLVFGTLWLQLCMAYHLILYTIDLFHTHG